MFTSRECLQLYMLSLYRYMYFFFKNLINARISYHRKRNSDSINANLPIFDKLLQLPQAAKAELFGIHT